MALVPFLMVPLDCREPIHGISAAALREILRTYSPDLPQIMDLPHAPVLIRAFLLHMLLAKTVGGCPQENGEPILAAVSTVHIPGADNYTGNLIAGRSKRVLDLIVALISALPREAQRALVESLPEALAHLEQCERNRN